MSNFQKEKLRKLLKPCNIPKSSQSAKNSPRTVNSIDFSNNDSRNFTQSMLNKSACRVLMKSLNELTINLGHILKKSRIYDKDLCDLVQTCESSLKIAKQKISELSLDEDFFKFSESKSSQNTSTILKSDTNEYCYFLEYLLAYEQTRSEVIIKKAKFPKTRMHEIEKSLFEDYSLKNPGYFKSVKNTESWFKKKSENELKELFTTIKTKLTNNAKISQELESLLKDDPTDIQITSNATHSYSQTFIDSSKLLSKEKKKIQDLYESSIADNKKLSAKYNYLISKLNKQDTTLKRQAKILANISKDSKELKENFEEFVNEMKFYLSMLSDHLSKSPSKRIPVTSHLKEKAMWENDKEKLKKELETCKKNSSELETKLQNALKELILLKDQEELSDDSLDLGRTNINDLIEIQKLKEQLRLLNFKLNEQYANYKGEIDGLKTNIGKLKIENFSYEERFKTLNANIIELSKENERLLEEVTKNKTSQVAFEQFKPIPMLNGDTFNVCEPSESSLKVNPADILAMVADEVEEIMENLKSNNIFPDFHNNGVALLRKVAEFIIGLKSNLCEESEYFPQAIEEIIQEYKTRVNSGDKGFEMDQRMDTESYIFNKQLEIYKTKLKDKKTQLELCHKQISYLKKSLKESKDEVFKANPIDLECVKGMFENILKEVSQLSQKTETLIEVMMKTLGFTHDEILKINNERISKKSSWFSKGLF